MERDGMRFTTSWTQTALTTGRVLCLAGTQRITRPASTRSRAGHAGVAGRAEIALGRGALLARHNGEGAQVAHATRAGHAQQVVPRGLLGDGGRHGRFQVGLGFAEIIRRHHDSGRGEGQIE